MYCCIANCSLQVVERRRPVYPAGSTGCTITHDGRPKVGLLLEDVWDVGATVRFRVINSPSAVDGGVVARKSANPLAGLSGLGQTTQTGGTADSAAQPMASSATSAGAGGASAARLSTAMDSGESSGAPLNRSSSSAALLSPPARPSVPPPSGALHSELPRPPSIYLYISHSATKLHHFFYSYGALLILLSNPQIIIKFL